MYQKESNQCLAGLFHQFSNKNKRKKENQRDPSDERGNDEA